MWSLISDGRASSAPSEKQGSCANAADVVGGRRTTGLLWAPSEKGRDPPPPDSHLSEGQSQALGSLLGEFESHLHPCWLWASFPPSLQPRVLVGLAGGHTGGCGPGFGVWCARATNMYFLSERLELCFPQSTVARVGPDCKKISASSVVEKNAEFGSNGHEN